MIAGLFALLLGGQAAAQPASCAALSSLQLPDVTITEAVAVAANTPAPAPPSPLGAPP